MTSSKRPSDEELAGLRFRITDPAAMQNYSRDRPDPNLTPTIVGQYDLRPEGGLKRMKETPFFWCCHCQKDNHWLGYGITNETGRSYPIGKDCAAKHYGVEFARIRRNFVELSTRQGVLERLRTIRDSAGHVDGAVNAILRSAGLAAVDAKRNEIERAHSNAAFLMSAAANSGSPLQEDIRVRDVEAERRRAERLGDRDPGTPILQSRRSTLGPLEGRALMRTQSDCRDLLLALRAALSVASKLKDGDTNAVPTKDLTKVVRAVEDAHAAAVEGIDEARRASRFFGDRNLDRLERWSASHRDFRISRTGDGIEIRSPDHDPVAIARLAPIVLPDMPSFEQIAAAHAGAVVVQAADNEGDAAPIAVPVAWSPDRVERMRALWLEGKPAAEIGRALGISRNAVIGKAKRMRLPTRPSGDRSTRPS